MCKNIMLKKYINIILTVFLFCTEKYKPQVDNTDRACEVGILTEGLYFEVRIRKQLVLYLLTGRNSVNKKGFKSKANEWFYERQEPVVQKPINANPPISEI